MKSILRLLPAVLLAAVSTAPAAIVFSGTVGIPIPYTFNGVYLNVLTGQTATSQPSDFYGSPGAPWINIDFAGVDVSNGDALFPSIQNTDQVLNIPLATPIGPAGTYVTGPSASTTHLGSGAGQFVASTPGYIGFSMNPTGGGQQFGWIQVSLNDDNTGGVIHSYAYESTIAAPIAAGAIPEPGVAYALLVTAGLCLWRRKR